MLNEFEINAKIEDLTRKSEDQKRQTEELKRQLENQKKDEKVNREELERQIGDLKRQLEDLRQELNLTKTTLSANVVIQDEDTQSLIALTNSFTERMQSHQSLNLLSGYLVKDLRKYCEDLIPLASGMYLPHHRNKLSTELTHVTAHLAEHLVHEAAHPALHYLPSLSEVIKVTGGVMHQVPLLSFGLAIFDIISSHRLIHHAKHTAGKLSFFSSEQRDTLYHYVIASTLLSLVTRINTNTPINHPIAEKHRLSGSTLMEWYTLLLAESISSLMKLHNDHDIQGINDLAIRWSKSIVSKFLQLGANMPNSLEINQVIYNQNELEVALKIQRIFTEPKSNSSHNYLAKSLRGYIFLNDFHSELYNKVLRPYKRCANRGDFMALITGYHSVLETLKKWQSRFIHALDVVNEKLPPGSKNFELQLSLINICLYGNLQSMSSDMPWHLPANRLLVSIASQNLDCIREPLKLTDNNELVLAIRKTLVEEANASRAAKAEEKLAISDENLANSEKEHAKTKEKLANSEEEHAKTKEKLANSEENFANSEKEHAKTKEKLIEANARSEEYKARAEEAEALDLRTQQTITSLQRVTSTSQQSSLRQNSLFQAPAARNITERDIEEFSNNSTLQ